MKTYAHLARWALDQPWAVTPRMLNIIQGILAERLSGNIPSPAVIAGRIAEERDLAAADTRRGGRLAGAVAVMPVYGVLMQRMDMMMEMSGGTSVELLSRQFKALLNDPAVGTIVLDVDSPGGGVYGIAEFAEEVFKARGQKRIVAQANSVAASAAYWIATAAEELIVTPTGEVGSIGVYMLHEDWSGAYEMLGVKPTVLKFGENKAEGIDVEPLSDSARAHFQTRVDQYGNMFEAAVAKHRGVSKATVHGEFGQGMVFGAWDAVRLKMADRVATLEETIVRFAGSQSTGAAAGRALAPEQMAALKAAGYAPDRDPDVFRLAADVFGVDENGLLDGEPDGPEPAGILNEDDPEPVPAGRSLRDAEARYRHGKPLTRPQSV